MAFIEEVRLVGLVVRLGRHFGMSKDKRPLSANTLPFRPRRDTVTRRTISEGIAFRGNVLSWSV